MFVIVRGLVTFVVLSFLTVSIAAQNHSEQYCKRIEDSVIGKLRPTKMNRADVYTHECVFEFMVGTDIEVLLRIQKHQNEEDGHRVLDKTLSLTATFHGLDGKEELRLDRFDPNGNWDEVYFMKSTEINSGFLLLRKGRVSIEILSLKDEILKEAERLLSDEIGTNLTTVSPRQH